jgi:hypothetical protein
VHWLQEGCIDTAWTRALFRQTVDRKVGLVWKKSEEDEDVCLD